MTLKKFEDLQAQMVLTSFVTIDTHDVESKYVYAASEMLTRKVVSGLICL